MTMMAVLKWNSIYMYILYILFWWDPLGFFRPSCMFGEVFLDLLGQAWILPLKEDMMCVLIVSFGKVKQSETFCILQNHTNPPFSFLNLWFREKMRKGCLFFELFQCLEEKTIHFFGWKHLYFHRSSRSNFEGQKPSPLHHRWCTSCQEYRTLTSEVEDQGANGNGIYVWDVCCGYKYIRVSNMWISKLTLIKCAYRRFGRWLLRSSRLTMYKGASCKFQSLL